MPTQRRIDLPINDFILPSKKFYLRKEFNENLIKHHIKPKNVNSISGKWQRYNLTWSRLQSPGDPPPSPNSAPVFADISVQTEESKVKILFIILII